MMQSSRYKYFVFPCISITMGSIKQLKSNVTDEIETFKSNKLLNVLKKISEEATGSSATTERELIKLKQKRHLLYEKRRNLKKKLKRVSDDIFSNEEMIENTSKRIIQLGKILIEAETKLSLAVVQYNGVHVEAGCPSKAKESVINVPPSTSIGSIEESGNHSSAANTASLSSDMGRSIKRKRDGNEDTEDYEQSMLKMQKKLMEKLDAIHETLKQSLKLKELELRIKYRENVMNFNEFAQK